MIKKKSVYKCPVCKQEIRREPAKRQICSECRVVMVEEAKGMITK